MWEIEHAGIRKRTRNNSLKEFKKISLLRSSWRRGTSVRLLTRQLWIRFPHGGRNYSLLIFYIFALEPCKARRWIPPLNMECLKNSEYLYTGFPLATMLYAGYNVKLKKKSVTNINISKQKMENMQTYYSLCDLENIGNV